MRDNDLTVGTDDYLRLVLKKTAWYSFIHPMRIGALVANADDQNLDRFDRFGYLLGLAFQITDDVLNLVGDVGRYGKEIDGDLWEGKRTIVLDSRARSRRSGRPCMDGKLSGTAARAAAAARSAAAPPDPRDGAAASRGRSSRPQPSRRPRRASLRACAFAGVPESPDLNWLRACVDFLVQRDA